MRISKIIVLLACIGTASRLVAGEGLSLNAHLGPVGRILGKTWKGAFSDSTPEKPVVDVSHWERALNGQAVRATHSINQGVYGGETLFFWDEKKQAVVYYYFTTASFMTTGTIEFKDGKILTHEDVKGDAGGVSELRATSEILPAGTFHVKAEYLKDGQWKLGHHETYKVDASSEGVFK